MCTQEPSSLRGAGCPEGRVGSRAQRGSGRGREGATGHLRLFPAGHCCCRGPSPSELGARGRALVGNLGLTSGPHSAEGSA